MTALRKHCSRRIVLKKTKLYNAGQDAIWNDAPWIFLINEQNVSAKVKNLKKFYVQPDAGFDYYEAELD